MLTHSEAQALISASLDAPLDEDIEQILAEHLATCEECRVFAATSQRLSNALASMPTVPASPAVRQAVWARIEQPEPWWSRLGDVAGGRTAAIVSTAAIALLIIAFAVLAIARLSGDNRGTNDGTRLAAGTQQALALATGTATPPPTQTPTALPPTATQVPPTETPAPPTATTAPRTVARTEVPVDLTGGGEPTSTVAPATQIPTETPVPPTSTSEPTETPLPTETPAATAAPTETATPAPTETPEPTATPAPTETPEPTSTPEPGNLTVTVVDQDGNPVPDACFVLVQDGNEVAQSCDTTDWETEEFASNGNTGFFDVAPGTYTLRLASLPEDVTVEDREIEIAPAGDDTVTIEVRLATPAPAPTATPAPTQTPEPTSTPAPTATPIPATETPAAPTATPAPPTATGEATSPPIEPINGQPSDTGEEPPAPTEAPASTEAPAGTATAAEGPSQQIIAPAEATQAATSVDGTGGESVIEPIDGGATVAAATATSESPRVESATEAPATIRADTPAAAMVGEGVDLASAPFYSDGEPWGDASARLAWDGDQVVFTDSPDGFSLEHPTLTVQSQTDGDIEYLAICQGGDCADATRDGGEGARTDAPIGWVGDRLIYERSTGDGSVEVRALDWDAGAMAPAGDTRIGTIDQPFSPLGRGYDAQAGTLIAGTDAWMLITDSGASIVDGNPYGEPRLVRTAFADPVIAYAAGDQLIVAPQDAPGSPIVTIPFSGVDFDISPEVDRIVVSTGSGLEIWSFDGELLGSSGTGVKTGSVVWLSGGIVFIDQTNGNIRLIDPAALTG